MRAQARHGVLHAYVRSQWLELCASCMCVFEKEAAESKRIVIAIALLAGVSNRMHLQGLSHCETNKHCHDCVVAYQVYISANVTTQLCLFFMYIKSQM